MLFIKALPVPKWHRECCVWGVLFEIYLCKQYSGKRRYSRQAEIWGKTHF